MFDGEIYADFVVLWLLCHQSRVEGERSELTGWKMDAARGETWHARP